MMSKLPAIVRVVLFGLMSIATFASPVLSCPFCTPNVTLTERIEQSHAAFAVEWVSGQEGDAEAGEPGQTTVKVTHVFKSKEPRREVRETIDLAHFSPGQPGEAFLLFGHLRDGEVLRWDGLQPCPGELMAYLTGRPNDELPPQDRLLYFVDNLEHADETIAVDAYSEFANARYEDVQSVARYFPRDKLVRWVSEPDAATGRIARIGFYGLILGLCGGESEAAALERVILAPGEDFRLGIDGLMAGYLMLRGDAGLDVLSRHAFSEDTPSSEAFALQQAVRFLWDHGEGRISPEALRAALRPLVDDPQFAELVIVDLTRWEDFELVDQLIDQYSEEDFANLPTQTAIARYYLAISGLDAEGRPVSEVAAIARAGEHLAALRERDPEVVERAERMFRSLADAATADDGEQFELGVSDSGASSSPSEPGQLEVQGVPGDVQGELDLLRWLLMACLAIGIIVGIVTWPRRSREPTG